jgi:cathepsin X
MDFDWGNVDGINYLTIARNQHIPNYCGACWAFAAASALSDRIKIARRAAWPDVSISPQVLLSCEQTDQGCYGGDSFTAYEWISENNITDETCSPFQALGWTNGLQCSAETKCKNCMPGSGCYAQGDAHIYGVSQYGRVAGEEAMMNEIYQRGPISCGMAVTNEFLNYTGGIFVDTTGDVEEDHDISIIGWGFDEETGQKYWIGRNSWGTYWGIKGFFKIIRGVNNLAIEQDCHWAVPTDTWTKDVRNTTTPSAEELIVKEEILTKRKGRRFVDGTCKREFKEMSHITGPQPYEYIDSNDLPANWDWRNVNGQNYLSWNVNQHIPVYCGSCWAQAPSSALADRINILRNNTWPQMALAPQVIINCKAGGSCNGGNSLGVYAFARSTGIPEETCQQYVAKNPDQFSCSAIQKCMNCRPTDDFIANPDCYAMENYYSWKVSQYGVIIGAARMKAEIYARGPISCGIDATQSFEEYTSGIFSQHLILPLLNHEISVVGWGVDPESGIEYWIGRNSWGTYWGEYGFFKIQMYKDNLGIETQCSFGVPILTYD